VKTSATCDPPTNLAAGTITTNSIDISWTSTTNATSYTVEYKLTSTSTWTTATTNNLTYTLNSLSQNTGYNIRVKASCGASQSSSYSNEITVTTSVSTGCDMPTGLAASNITNTSCLMTWSVAAGAINYSLDYTPVSNPTGWITATPNGTSQTLSNLTPNTIYQARIKTVCGGGASSAYSSIITFSTLPTAFSKVQIQSNPTPYNVLSADNEIANHITIAPNPAIEEFDVLFSFPQKSNVTLQLMDAYGKLILTEKITLQEGRYNINIHDLPTGIYFLQVVIDDKERLIKKVVKQR
jgi:Secretion system C-terminal sorting domain/Fibronectin type III domain